MSRTLSVFLDFDDTLSDPFELHLQYVREVGGYLSDRYGEDAVRWSRAAIDMLEAVQGDYLDRFERNPLSGYCVWLDTIWERAALGMFEQMGMAPPPEPARVAQETQFNGLVRCNAAFAGASEALASLHDSGWIVRIASGQESKYLTAALIGAGLDRYVGRRFGPDLVDCAKEGPEYYERVFESVGVTSADAVVVDDDPHAIGWAIQTGATVIQSKLSRVRHFEAVQGIAAVMNDLRELPGLVTAALDRASSSG